MYFIPIRIFLYRNTHPHTHLTPYVAGVTSPHWIDHTHLDDMLAQERDEDNNKPPQSVWALSTQTFDIANQPVPQPTTMNPSTPPAASAAAAASSGDVGSGGSGREEGLSRETDGGERTASMAASVSPSRQNVKPNRPAPSPPKARKKSKGRRGTDSSKDSDYNDPVPYLYPLHKMRRGQPAQPKTGGNQSHEYAQPHAVVHARNDMKKSTANGGTGGKHEYLAIDPKLQQPAGHYQDLLPNGLPRGQSLPAISTFAAMNS